MTTELSVDWVRTEKAMEEFGDYYCEWRTKVAAGQDPGTLVGLNRRVVVEVTEEANSRAAFNFNEFPYERPRAGELPGFFAVKPTVESEELRKTHQAIHREFGFLNVYGYYAEMSAIAADMVVTMEKTGVPNLPAGEVAPEATEWEEVKKRKEMEMSVILGLSRVLQQVALDCMRMRGDFVRMIGTDGLAVASWTMDDLVAAGEVGGSQKFGAASRKIKTETLKERMKVRAKMEAHKMEGAKMPADPDVAASGERPSGGPSARRN